MPSSSPITPPPITTICSGTLGSSSAPVLSTTTFWSISTPGSGVTDEPVAMTMFLAVTVRSPTLTLLAPVKAGIALQPFDLVLLEQEFDAAGQLLDRVLALAVHRVEVELRLHLDAELGEGAVGRGVIIFRRVEHRLGRDAADVEAGPAERLAPFGAGGLEAELRGADRGDIAAGTGADHQDVVVEISHSS